MGETLFAELACLMCVGSTIAAVCTFGPSLYDVYEVAGAFLAAKSLTAFRSITPES